MNLNHKKLIKKSIKTVVLILIIQLTIFSVIVLGANFTDTNGKWYEETIDNCVNKGWVNGYEDGTFRGDNPITRAEFVTMLNRMLENKEIGQSNFSDVSESDWYYTDIQKAMALNIINGYEDGTFKPENNILRQDAILILSRLPEIKEITDYTVALPADQNSSSSYAYGTVIKMYSLRIVKGNEKNRVNPQDNITRAEALALIERTYNYINGLLPEFVEPQFIIKDDVSFGKTRKCIYVVNTSDLYQYTFEAKFENPKELNIITTTASDGITFTINYTEEPSTDIIMQPTSKELKLFTFNTWQVYDAYKGYIPKKGEKITVKVTVTNDKKTITKDYFIDYIVE